jgi:hypothetical protein
VESYRVEVAHKFQRLRRRRVSQGECCAKGSACTICCVLVDARLRPVRAKHCQGSVGDGVFEKGEVDGSGYEAISRHHRRVLLTTVYLNLDLIYLYLLRRFTILLLQQFKFTLLTLVGELVSPF